MTLAEDMARTKVLLLLYVAWVCCWDRWMPDHLLSAAATRDVSKILVRVAATPTLARAFQRFRLKRCTGSEYDRQRVFDYSVAERDSDLAQPCSRQQ
jgi:hypothetical protein